MPRASQKELTLKRVMQANPKNRTVIERLKKGIQVSQMNAILKKMSGKKK